MKLEDIPESENHRQHSYRNRYNETKEEEQHRGKVHASTDEHEAEYLPEMGMYASTRMCDRAKDSDGEKRVGGVVEFNVHQRREGESDREVDPWYNKEEESKAHDAFQNNDH